MFRNGLKEGSGKLTKPDGTIYEGRWSQNKMHGNFKVYLRDGEIQEGSYVNGKKDGEWSCI